MMRKLAATVTRPIKLASWTPAPKRNAAQGWPDRSRYRADNLPAIRKRKGIGRPLKVFMCEYGPRTHRGMMQAVDVNAMAAKVDSAKNLAEWERKRRRGESAEDYHLRAFNRVRDGISRALGEMGFERVTP
jgi:hypothetical protein